MTRPDEAEVPEVGPDEELATALVDGEATAAEAQRAGEPGVADAFAAHAEVARLVGGPVEPPSAAARDTAIAAALAAFDRGETDEPVVVADELAGRRSRPRIGAWLGAVAAALVVLAGLGLFASLAANDDSSTSDETAAASSTDESAPASTTAAAAPAGDAAEDATSAAGAGGATYGAAYLGDYLDIEALFTAVRADPEARREAATDVGVLAEEAPASEFAGLPCVPEAETIDAVVLGTATLDGELVTVLLETLPDGTRSIVVLAEPDCEAARSAFGP